MILPTDVTVPPYDDRTRQRRLEYLSLTERDRTLLQELDGLVQQNLQAIVDRFYQHLLSNEETARVFKDEAMVRRLKEAQRTYLRESLHGPYDAAYFTRRWRIGLVHNAIKLEPHWFIGAFQLYHRILYPMILERYREDPDAALERILALDKVMNLDEQLGIESYMAHYVATMDQLQLLNAQIQEASAAKSRFLANMSHEFRTPLNAIIGFTEVLQDEVAGTLTDEQGEYLGEIHKAGEMLLHLVNDVLDLAKVEAGRLELFYETFPVAQFIRESLTALRGAAEAKGLTLEMKLSANLGFVTADRVRLTQILHNLLSNAVKFTERGTVTVSAQNEDDNLHLSVRDTGIGIRPEDQETIFEEFRQLEAGEGRPQEGTGLGLAVSRRLVEAHGGRIWVEGKRGRGSVFHVLLPLAPQRRVRSASR